MRKITLLLATGIMLATAGCVPSLNPLYTKQDLVFEAALVGVWAEDDAGKDTWAFERSGEEGYRLVYASDGKKGEFEVHLLKLGKTQFLDLYPDDAALSDLNRNDFYKAHLIAAHTFAKVTQIEPNLRMAFLNPDWLKEHLQKNPKAIRHEKINDDRIVLTASTKELQEFVLKHAGEAFGDASDLKRKKPKQ